MGQILNNRLPWATSIEIDANHGREKSISKKGGDRLTKKHKWEGEGEKYQLKIKF